MNFFLKITMDMYIELQVELNKDETWISSSYIEKVIKYIKKLDGPDVCITDIKNRTKRCIARREDRKIPTDVFIKEKNPEFGRVLDILYSMQKKCTFNDLKDFECNICCPNKYTNEYLRYIIGDMSDARKDKFDMFINHKLYNSQTILDGMYLAKTIDIINHSSTARRIISHIDELYKTKTCNMCTYLILCLCLYNIAPITIVELKFNETYLDSLNSVPYKLYLETNKPDYLYLFALLIGKYSYWYKDFNTLFKLSASYNLIDPNMCFKEYTNSDPMTLNYTLNLTELTDIEKAYIEVGKDFYSISHNQLTQCIIDKKGKEEINMLLVDCFLMVNIFQYDLRLLTVVHTAVLKYIFSIKNE